jgi:hypothetical protein
MGKVLVYEADQRVRCGTCNEDMWWAGKGSKRQRTCACTPEPKKAGASAKYRRRKGALLERNERKKLEALGVTTARTQPGSGAYGTRNDISNLQGDNAFRIAGKPFRQECKARASDDGFATIKGWMRDCEVLTIKQDRQPPFHVLSDEAWRHLVQAANRGEG